jgi:hypothetical protein
MAFIQGEESIQAITRFIIASLELTLLGLILGFTVAQVVHAASYRYRNLAHLHKITENILIIS